MNEKIILAGVIFYYLCCYSLSAQLSIPSVFGDNMVLQQESNVAVWGYGNRDEIVKITGSWAPYDTVCAKADVLGKFIAYLPTKNYGGPYTLSVLGSQKYVFRNVMLGEVWLCSGQSNMAMALNATKNAMQELEHAENPNIRIFSIARKGAENPQNDCSARWVSCSSENARHTSAVAYYFAKKINKETECPIGIIVSSYGGTPAEAWTPDEVVEKDEEISNDLCKELWETRPSKPGVLYNWMIHPIIPYSIAGCIWYQGESNHSHHRVYAKLLGSMVASWRDRFGIEFPFYVVQIAPYKYNSAANTPALLREQQEIFTQKVKKTGLIVISDLVDDLNDIHPVSKKMVGYRLANLALGDHYKQNIKGYKSPTFNKIHFEKGKAVIQFKDVEKLTIKPACSGLEVAGEDGLFSPANGKIKENRLYVWSAKVKNPVYVRYCFTDSYEPCLFDETGLPVAPFRTDSF
ncbi:MAG: sialate O-acetylesterase [Prevotella sp.]|jgi:sialate O-acetylesterase|nr:sialate O-acetylesterase [Prevotella sp.]